MTEAERRYFERVGEDVSALLGDGIELDDLIVERARRRVTLRAVYRLGGSSATSEGSGPTLVAAHAALRAAIVEDRIALSLRAFIESVR